MSTRAMEIAAALALRINGDSIVKGSGATISAADAYPAAVAIAEAEQRIDAAGRALADQSAALQSMLGPERPDFPCTGAAAPADAPLSPAERERVAEIIATFEGEIFG